MLMLIITKYSVEVTPIPKINLKTKLLIINKVQKNDNQRKNVLNHKCLLEILLKDIKNAIVENSCIILMITPSRIMIQSKYISTVLLFR